jgi:predicted metal-dependent phosphoesterase TrpH
LDFKSQVGIDLHVHTTASDGSLSPSATLALAHNLGLGALAITDHDTLQGAREALITQIPSSLAFLPGVEISSTPPQPFGCSGSFHILGYGIDIDHTGLNRALEELQTSRRERNPKIVRRLQALGMDIALSEVATGSINGSVGRPHIARVMLAKGFVDSIDEAFARFLGPGQPAYVDKQRMACEQAIELIAAAGGLAVLAHPSLIALHADQTVPDLIACLKPLGLAGIEVFYPEHSKADTVGYQALAEQHDLLMTGGTDFHGSLKPEIQLGTGTGHFHVPLALYERLAHRLNTIAPGT